MHTSLLRHFKLFDGAFPSPAAQCSDYLLRLAVWFVVLGSLTNSFYLLCLSPHGHVFRRLGQGSPVRSLRSVNFS
jgi:hypothetical protein